MRVGSSIAEAEARKRRVRRHTNMGKKRKAKAALAKPKRKYVRKNAPPKIRGYIERLRALLLDPTRRAEVTHPDPERAIALGFMMFFGALRETTVFGEVWPEHRELVGENLGDEMAHLYLSYLGVRSEKARVR